MLAAFTSLLVAGLAAAAAADAGAQPSHSSSRNGTTMIVLYACTAGVSALFVAIIVSGAIRAIRHPERYGRHAGDGENWGPTTARGLTRAILDTFPTIKFTRQERKDIEAQPKPALELVAPPSDPPTRATFSVPVVETQPEPGPSSPLDDAIPDAIGRETCPICILDFEEGDDLRVLPCEGSHRFHTTCVDRWLLELSTACPICRHDFITLENMISASYEDLDASNRRSSGLRRLSRYLRFARHRRVEPDEELDE
ncbi:hypothetical protein FB45DRAFT_893034 [Roridomyces roridus]|uniref:RING-type domain-containing protein n=1 Tax=Roridomyces roridus TaxID=1738132 RepID=A0AAD7FWL4_9AGAR|nr:hypothetical protein FB45DRAFT_893034 [Roridomyces roridus]